MDIATAPPKLPPPSAAYLSRRANRQGSARCKIDPSLGTAAPCSSFSTASTVAPDAPTSATALAGAAPTTAAPEASTPPAAACDGGMDGGIKQEDAADEPAATQSDHLCRQLDFSASPTPQQKHIDALEARLAAMEAALSLSRAEPASSPHGLASSDEIAIEPASPCTPTSTEIHVMPVKSPAPPGHRIDSGGLPPRLRILLLLVIGFFLAMVAALLVFVIWELAR